MYFPYFFFLFGTHITMSDQVIKQVDDILLMLRRGTPVVEVREKHAEFTRERPTLFRMMQENPYSFDRAKLIQMLHMKRQICNGEMSAYQGAARWGKQMADEYLPENLQRES